jgi:hypothetical protein
MYRANNHHWSVISLPQQLGQALSPARWGGMAEIKEEGESTTTSDDKDDAVWYGCHDSILWFEATQTR